mmetsp:Transcript_61963/g.124252  ORF Transcript_61963/g.124252 Transcript_61963/m.124252 type:complete len:371 (-) Transcript_61963:615-1727(-)
MRSRSVTSSPRALSKYVSTCSLRIRLGTKESKACTVSSRIARTSASPSTDAALTPSEVKSNALKESSKAFSKWRRINLRITSCPPATDEPVRIASTRVGIASTSFPTSLAYTADTSRCRLRNKPCSTHPPPLPLLVVLLLSPCFSLFLLRVLLPPSSMESVLFSTSPSSSSLPSPPSLLPSALSQPPQQQKKPAAGALSGGRRQLGARALSLRSCPRSTGSTGLKMASKLSQLVSAPTAKPKRGNTTKPCTDAFKGSSLLGCQSSHTTIWKRPKTKPSVAPLLRMNNSSWYPHWMNISLRSSGLLKKCFVTSAFKSTSSRKCACMSASTRPTTVLACSAPLSTTCCFTASGKRFQSAGLCFKAMPGYRLC